MSDEPALPHLPAVSWNEQSQTFSNNPRKRVRGRHARNAPQSVVNSSDPAVFSSDDDPGLDNYVAGRRKKRYVGSWFLQQPASSDSAIGDGCSAPSKPKRKLARQLDSGVFLGSDGTESDDMADCLDVPVRTKFPQLEQQVAPKLSMAEVAVREKIQSCLEQGEETVDCWYMGLEELSNDTIRPLSTFSCIPLVTKDVAFEQKEPELKIYLAKNSLSKLPGALFDLTHLTILSLRGNMLTELPPSISKLCNLTDLNLGQNQLRHLPADLLRLMEPGGRLQKLVLHPNPFVQPDRSLGEPAHSATEQYAYKGHADGNSRQHFVSRHLGRTPLQVSDSSGNILSDFKLSSRMDGDKTLEVELPSGEANTSTSAQAVTSRGRGALRSSTVPSLLEAALRGCYRSDQLQHLKYYIPDDFSHLRELLDRAADQKEMGGLSCSRCGRLMVMPTGEWIEWRELRQCSLQWFRSDILITLPFSDAEEEMAVPFLHRACSWRCGPGQGSKDEEKEWCLPRGCTHRLEADAP